MTAHAVRRLTVDGLAPPVRVTWRPAVLNLSVGETDAVAFDAAGRLIGAFRDGRNYRRGFDNRLLAKWRAGGERQRRWLDTDEAQAVIAWAYDLAARVHAHLPTGDSPIRAALERIGMWDWDALERDRAQFQQVYRPVSILPPDQYLALVLQATEGCTHNACTFCHFYRDRAFRIRPPDEFEQHIATVRAFLGPSILLRKSIFLADANALVIPQARLLPMLRAVGQAFPIGQPAGDHPGFAGIYSFIDAFHVERKSVADWQALAALGLRRAYIGMETGDDALLRFLNKPGTVADVVEATARLKAAGVAVSVIVMPGIGGDRYGDAHVQGTVRALNAMPLGSGDLIYFSEFVPFPGTEYAALAQDAGIAPLNLAAMRGQEAAIRAGLRWHDPHRPPQMSRYDVREFIYG